MQRLLRHHRRVACRWQWSQVWVPRSSLGRRSRFLL